MALVTGAVTAGPASAAPTQFPSSVTPKTGVHAGTVLTDVGTGAAKSTSYACVQVIVKTTTQVYAVKLSSVKYVTSTAAGRVTCKQTFQPWSSKDTKGVVRHCPLSAADKAAGFKCGVALGDKATQGRTTASLATFSTA
jgi:hypothetical protein